MTHHIVLPWPCRYLHPNTRVHWSVRAKAAKAARRDAYIIACGMGARALGWDGAAVRLTFCPPSRGVVPDLDNALTAHKGALDALAAVLGVNDRRFFILIERGDRCRDGAVIVEMGVVE